MYRTPYRRGVSYRTPHKTYIYPTRTVRHTVHGIPQIYPTPYRTPYRTVYRISYGTKIDKFSTILKENKAIIV